jgi:uncharacterized membrane protein YhaH (DUF805 family)
MPLTAPDWTASDRTAFVIGLFSVAMGLITIVVAVRRRSADFAHYASLLWCSPDTASNNAYWAKWLLWSILVAMTMGILGSLTGLAPGGEPEKDLPWYDDATFAAIGGICYGAYIGSVIGLVALGVRRFRKIRNST